MNLHVKSELTFFFFFKIHYNMNVMVIYWQASFKQFGFGATPNFIVWLRGYRFIDYGLFEYFHLWIATFFVN